MSYSKILRNSLSTPQNKPARADQVPNNAGGYAFGIDKWAQLDRFLIIGTADGTYYVGATDLTKMNLDAVKACTQEDGLRVVERCRDLSQAGRALKNDPAILVLAACMAWGSDKVKAKVKAALPEVCRTGTHILHFASYADSLRKWGRSLRSAVATWYKSQEVDHLAYQMVKYQSRDGWSHKDLIRLSHVGSNDPKVAALYDWALHGRKEGKDYPDIVEAFEAAKIEPAEMLVHSIEAHNLSREMVPTNRLNEPSVATALALKSPPWALLRNLGSWTAQGLIAPGSPVFKKVMDTFGNAEALRKARLHPMTILVALKTYASGQGVRGSQTWTPVPQVVDALDKAFYLAFANVQPTGQRIHIAVDVSGSMTAACNGTPGFMCLEAGAAMALVTAATEPNYSVVAFDTQVHPVTLSPRSRLDDAMAALNRFGGGTDVASPVVDLLARREKVDAIVIYTDSETWAGRIHPFEALQEYRRQVNPQVKFIVAAMAANHVTVVEPNDPLSLGICGFDASIPEVLRAFLTGNANSVE